LGPRSNGTTSYCTAKLFFPQSVPLVGTLQAFANYFVGFLARPIGAAIFGHCGDRIGRKSTLIATLIVMGVATFLVGLVPSYAVIGIWGAIALTVLRFVQGIGVGGEWEGSVLLGPAPLIATALLARYHSGYAIARYLVACAVVSFVATVYMTDRTNRGIEDRDYVEASA
jgi:MFS family permease